MKISPISAEEADAGSFGDPFKPDDYDFQIYAAEETVSKQNNDMLKITLHVFNTDGEKRTIFDYILSSQSGQWKARHLMQSIGMLRQYEAGNIDPHEIQGRPGLCKLGIEPARGDYPAKNKIVDYILPPAQPAVSTASTVRRPADPAARKPVPAGGGIIDDEIPFTACWQ